MGKKGTSEPCVHKEQEDARALDGEALVPIMRFRKIKDEGNCLGYNEIEILVFNYDGSGGALLRSDGELNALGKIDLGWLLFGDAWSGEKSYELIGK